jgi:hypothetical protein
MICGCDSSRDFRAKIGGLLGNPPLLHEILYERMPPT